MNLREIDHLVHVHVMGFAPGLEGAFKYVGIPAYSEFIAPAMQVVKALDTLAFVIERENCMGIRWDVIVYDSANCEDKVHVLESTAPLAICLGALKWKGIEYEA